MNGPLHGRTTLVTGVSRTRGIGAAIARRLAQMGASLVVHHHRTHDELQPWGADDLADVLDDLRGHLVEGGEGRLNTVNPGPVNTGYLDEGVVFSTDELAAARAHFPGGQFGEPDDPARLIGWLVSDEGRWVVGQVINTEGGFRRW